MRSLSNSELPLGLKDYPRIGSIFWFRASFWYGRWILLLTAFWENCGYSTGVFAALDDCDLSFSFIVSTYDFCWSVWVIASTIIGFSLWKILFGGESPSLHSLISVSLKFEERGGRGTVAGGVGELCYTLTGLFGETDLFERQGCCSMRLTPADLFFSFNAFVRDLSKTGSFFAKSDASRLSSDGSESLPDAESPWYL